MGRNEKSDQIMSKFMQEACERNKLKIIIDADALWFLSKNLSIRTQMSAKNSYILTPNIIEFSRILDSFGIPNTTDTNDEIEFMN